MSNRESKWQKRGRRRREKERGREEGRRMRRDLQDEGRAEEKVQLLFLSYGNGNEVGQGAGDNRGPQAG